MLDSDLIPTRLLRPTDRPAVEIAKEQPPPRFLVARTCIRLLGWALGAVWLRVIAPRTYKTEQARRLRHLFEELGGFWVKVGQLMSVRSDIFSAELCGELSRLQDRTTGFPFVAARLIAEAELERELSQVFDVFEERPFTAASIGQLHRAHLRFENVWVAVKVQRPFVAQTINKNLAFIKRLTSALDALSIMHYARWRDAYWEVEHILREQIDYRFEASSMQRIRSTLRRHGIFVPKVFERYSSRRILVMEFVTGVLMADYLHLLNSDPDRLAAWLEENNIDRRRIARRLQLSMLRQALEDNLYHADLHPGNIILLRNNRLALIDCGLIGFLELEYLEKFRLFFKALVELDYDKAADLSFLLSSSLPVKDLEPMKEDLVRTLRAWGARTFVKKLPYTVKSVASVWQEFTKVYVKYKCTFEWQILRLLRATMALDASLSRLYPEVNPTALGRLYFRQAERRTLKNFGTSKSLRQMLMNMAIATKLPEKAAELAFFDASFARRQAKVFEGATTKVANMFAVLFQNFALWCGLAAVVVILVLLERYAASFVSPIMIGIIARIVHGAPAYETDTWVLILIILAYLAWTFSKLRRRFSRKEMRPYDSGPRAF
jgi:ubiquinone biosynthesis protein